MSSETILTFRECQLLQHSYIIESHPWLKKLLQHNRTIKTSIVKQLPEEQQIFIENMLQSTLRSAIEEWKQDLSKPVEDMGPDKNNHKKCSLCGHRDTRYIFYIQNVINGKVLNVGSSCITRFEIKLNAPMNDLIEQAKQSRTWYILETKIPGIKKILDSWEDYLERYPLMIPNDLEERYLECYKSASLFFNNFLKNPKKTEHSIMRLRSCLENRARIIERIEVYMTEHKGNKLVPTRAIENWLLDNNERETYEQLKKDSRITLQTMRKIKEPDFMKSLIPDLNTFLQKLNITITDVINRGYELQIHRGMGKIVTVLLPHEFLIAEYGYYLFGLSPENQLSIEIMMPAFRIHREETYNEVKLYLNDELRKHGMSIEDFYFEFDDMIIKAPAERYYRVDSLRMVLTKHLGLVFGYGNIKEFVEELYLLKPMSKTDKKEFKNNRNY